MKYTYKLKKRIYCEVVFTDEDLGEGKSCLETQAVERANEEENDNPMELLCDGDEWEVEESTEEEEI